MINLLPTEQKKLLHGDYRQRILVVGGFLFSFLLFVSLIILVTLYFFISTGQKQAEVNLAEQQTKNSVTMATKLDQEVRLFNQKLSLLEKASTSTPVTTVVLAALSHRVPGIALETIGYNKSSDGVAVLDLSGTAQTRTELLAFLGALRSDPTFKQVDSPVSNLIKDRQADFSLKIQINDN